MRVRAADRLIEAQIRERPGQCERAGEILVGLLLPAGAPDELEAARERPQMLAGGRRQVVGDPVDHLERAIGPVRVVEPEQRDHAVDVDEQERSVGHGSGR